MKIILAYLLTSTAIFTACDSETELDAEFVIEEPSSLNISSDPSKSPAEMADRLSDLPLATEAFSAYTLMLSLHVDDLGFVNYDALHANPAALASYVESLAADNALPGKDQPDARLATLINAYNAFTLQLILDHYDHGKAPKSITDLHGGKPWDQKLWNLAGQTLSLNQIEHQIIRVEFPQEPRIHWAVVCAAYSCPPLRAEAYTAHRLNEQLADQEHRVLLSSDKRFIQKDGRTLKVSKLFEWYGSDFGNWKEYLSQRLESATPDSRYGFVDYNWALNSLANRR